MHCGSSLAICLIHSLLPTHWYTIFSISSLSLSRYLSPSFCHRLFLLPALSPSPLSSLLIFHVDSTFIFQHSSHTHQVLSWRRTHLEFVQIFLLISLMALLEKKKTDLAVLHSGFYWLFSTLFNILGEGKGQSGFPHCVAQWLAKPISVSDIQVQILVCCLKFK